MLTWIPVISPIDITLSSAGDTPLQAGPPQAEPTQAEPTQTVQAARIPGPPKDLDGPVRAVMYQDADWWRDKLAAARKRLRGEPHDESSS